MGPVKTEKSSWRELKERKKKWKEERKIKKLERGKQLEETILSNSTNPVSLTERATCSIAVPGSILENAQSNELRAYVAGQIARTACIYKIDEIIVFDDLGTVGMPVLGEDGKKLPRKCCTQFARLLQYLECPQYLRKSLFPMHKDLQYAGLMNPLDAPHHVRQDEDSFYREGIVTQKPIKSGTGCWVNIGLHQEIRVKESLTPGFRVTVKLKPSLDGNSNKLCGTIVSPDMPFIESNLYWGYNVRIAHSLTEVFSKCPYAGGYDFTIGTSEKGTNVDDLKMRVLKRYTHRLIVFGGLKGLEDAVENDEVISVNDPSLLFDLYLNVCPEQGSRTIRTEEAVLITLAELRKYMVINRET